MATCTRDNDSVNNEAIEMISEPMSLVTPKTLSVDSTDLSLISVPQSVIYSETNSGTRGSTRKSGTRKCMNNRRVFAPESTCATPFQPSTANPFPDGLLLPMSVRASKARSGRYGAFCVYPCAAGTALGFYRGEVIEAIDNNAPPSERCVFRPSTLDDSDLDNENAKGVWVDGTRGGNALQYVVDTYQPRIRISTKRKPPNAKLQLKDLAIITLCDLKAGDEIVMAYGKRRWRPAHIAGARPCDVQTSNGCHGSTVAPKHLRLVKGGTHKGKLGCLPCALKENRMAGVWKAR